MGQITLRIKNQDQTSPKLTRVKATPPKYNHKLQRQPEHADELNTHGSNRLFPEIVQHQSIRIQRIHQRT